MKVPRASRNMTLSNQAAFLRISSVEGRVCPCDASIESFGGQDTSTKNERACKSLPPALFLEVNPVLIPLGLPMPRYSISQTPHA